MPPFKERFSLIPLFDNVRHSLETPLWPLWAKDLGAIAAVEFFCYTCMAKTHYHYSIIEYTISLVPFGK